MVIVSFAACSDETPAPSSPKSNPIPQERELTRVEKLAQEWVLFETFENDVPKTQNGTQMYLFDEYGAFFTKSRSGDWMAIGNYQWAGSDSSAISVLLHGLNTPFLMEIKTLNDTALRTEFVSAGKILKYHYIR